MSIPIGVVGTALKHLSNKRTNYYKSLEMNPSSSDRDHYNTEIDKLNEAISYLDQVRESTRTSEKD